LKKKKREGKKYPIEKKRKPRKFNLESKEKERREENITS